MNFDLVKMFPHKNAEEFDFLEMQDFNNWFQDIMYDEYSCIRDMLIMGYDFRFIIVF